VGRLGICPRNGTQLGSAKLLMMLGCVSLTPIASNSLFAGVRGVLIYCADYRCSHSIAISGDRWPYKLSDMQHHFIGALCDRISSLRP
jgi:hypothetical protein